MTEEEYTELAKKFENRTPEEEEEGEQWAKDNGVFFTGPGAIEKAIAAAKAHRKVKVGISLDAGVLDNFKAKALKVGIPYQTLINSVLKRYAENTLDIDAA